MPESGPYTEYLNPAHGLVAEALANGGSVADELDAATDVLDRLLDAGWVLLRQDDLAGVLAEVVTVTAARVLGQPYDLMREVLDFPPFLPPRV